VSEGSRVERRERPIPIRQSPQSLIELLPHPQLGSVLRNLAVLIEENAMATSGVTVRSLSIGGLEPVVRCLGANEVAIQVVLDDAGRPAKTYPLKAIQSWVPETGVFSESDLRGEQSFDESMLLRRARTRSSQYA
jgi:hypothetical protein